MSIQVSTSPKARVLRTAVPLLVASHLLILVGGLLLIFGSRSTPSGPIAIGAVLLVAGILVEAWIIGWSIGLIHRAADVRRSVGENGPALRPQPNLAQRLCFACGWKGIVGSWSCPHCGHALANRPGE